MEGDGRRSRKRKRWCYFYPRPPGGGRHVAWNTRIRGNLFLSTPSGWRATVYRLLQSRFRLIFLSTPSGWRATILWFGFAGKALNFYPRPPGGGRRLGKNEADGSFKISIHALRVEGDRPPGRARRSIGNFYPRPPGGGRRRRRFSGPVKDNPFLSTPSGWRATTYLLRNRWKIIVFLSTPSGWRATNSHNKKYTIKIFLSTPSGWRATMI